MYKTILKFISVSFMALIMVPTAFALAVVARAQRNRAIVVSLHLGGLHF